MHKTPQNETSPWQRRLSSAELSPLLNGDTYPQAEPTEDAHGYYLEIGRGMGYFSWFPTRELMLRHLAHVEVLHLPARMPERADYEAMVDQLVPILEDFEQHQNVTQTVQAYHQVVPEIQLQWLGSVKTLKNDVTDFGKQVQSAFSENTSKSTSKSTQSWLDFLGEYGI